MSIIAGSVNVNGEVAQGKGFKVEIITEHGGWTCYGLSLLAGNMEDYSVVCQQTQNGECLITNLKGTNLLQVSAWTQGFNPVLPAFSFIAAKYS